MIILRRLQDIIFGIYSLKVNKLLLIMRLANPFYSIIAHENVSFHQVLSSDLFTDFANYILVTSQKWIIRQMQTLEGHRFSEACYYDVCHL